MIQTFGAIPSYRVRTATRGVFATLLLALIPHIGVGERAHAEKAASTSGPGLLTTLWEAPKDDAPLTLLVADQEKPLIAVVKSDTVFDGICLHCQLKMQFTADKAPKKCHVCACALTCSECLCGKGNRQNRWETMLRALPRGVALFLTFVEPDKPETGVKRALVDKRTVLLPVDGLESQSAEQLLALVKPLGGTQASLLREGKQLQITLKQDWTADKFSRLSKALEKFGAKVAFPAPSLSAQ